MKWIKPMPGFSRTTLVHITHFKNGVRISIPKEDADNISKAGKVAFGIDGNRLYIADDPKGYSLIEGTYRRYIILWNNYEDILPFAGKHPLFLDGMYYVSMDNTERK